MHGFALSESPESETEAFGEIGPRAAWRQLGQIPSVDGMTRTPQFMQLTSSIGLDSLNGSPDAAPTGTIGVEPRVILLLHGRPHNAHGVPEGPQRAVR